MKYFRNNTNLWEFSRPQFPFLKISQKKIRQKIINQKFIKNYSKKQNNSENKDYLVIQRYKVKNNNIPSLSS